MADAYIIDAVRTPRSIGKMGKGALSTMHPEHLSATVMAALREIRQGRFDVTLPAGASGELGELQATINEMAHGLSVRREELQALVESRTADLQAAMDQARSWRSRARSSSTRSCGTPRRNSSSARRELE